MQVNVNGNLGTAYGIQTGFDDNGDLIFNDRPAGVRRNTLLTDPTWMLNMFIGYAFTFGPSIQLPPGIQFGPGTGGTLTVTTVTRPDQGRYRMSVNVFINNLTNRANLTGYSGVETSEFYRRPTQSRWCATDSGEHEPDVLVCFYRTTRGFSVVGEPLFSNQSMPFADQIELQQVVAGRLRRDDLDGRRRRVAPGLSVSGSHARA